MDTTLAAVTAAVGVWLVITGRKKQKNKDEKKQEWGVWLIRIRG